MCRLLYLVPVIFTSKEKGQTEQRTHFRTHVNCGRYDHETRRHYSSDDAYNSIRLYCLLLPDEKCIV